MTEGSPVDADEIDAISREATLLIHLLCYVCERDFE